MPNRPVLTPMRLFALAPVTVPTTSSRVAAGGDRRFSATMVLWGVRRLAGAIAFVGAKMAPRRGERARLLWVSGRVMWVALVGERAGVKRMVRLGLAAVAARIQIPPPSNRAELPERVLFSTVSEPLAK